MNDKTRTAIMKEAIELFKAEYELEKIIEVISDHYPDSTYEGARSYVAMCGIEMFKSLLKAVDEVGGAGWSIDELCKMSVMDLISHLATNGVRFTYIRK